jgi:hypothetical protein
MSPRWIRRLVLLVVASGIAGMIVGSVAANQALVLTCGLMTALGAVALILVTAVAGPGAYREVAVDQLVAEEVERRVQDLVASGADDAEVRSLVRAAIRFGRRSNA